MLLIHIRHETRKASRRIVTETDIRSVQSLKIKTFFIDRSGLLEIVIELSWREIDFFFFLLHSSIRALSGGSGRRAKNFFTFSGFLIVIWIMNSANFSRYRERAYWMLSWPREVVWGGRALVGRLNWLYIYDERWSWTSFKSIEPWKLDFSGSWSVGWRCYFGLIGCRWAPILDVFWTRVKRA